MAQDDAERTEPATPKRRREARRKGDVAQSRDVTSILLLAAALGMLATFSGDALAGTLVTQARAAWGGFEIRPSSLADYHAVLLQHMSATGRALAPFLLALVAIGLVTSFAQVGPLFSVEALAFRGSRIDPVQGFKRLVSVDRLFELAKALLKLALVVGAAFLVLRAATGEILGLVDVAPAASLGAARSLAVRLALVSLPALALLAVLDLAWTRYRYEKKLKMSRRQVRDEMRERDGDPQVQGRRRQIQRELSRQRMIAEVAEADAVVTNPTHYAVALRYAAGEMAAPKVVAKGRNHVALRIREEARRHDVPILEDPPLARLLYRTTRVGREVPDSLYTAVAEVLAYVYRVDPRRAAGWRARS